MNTVKIRGLEIYGKIGVLEEEKKASQPFVFDIDLGVDFFEGAMRDDISLVVNYAEVCDLVAEIVGRGGLSLIEALAYECAFSIMERFPVNCALITVWKPQAPVEHEFKNIGVTVELKRERAYLSLGSNLGDRRGFLDFALSELEITRGIAVRKVSSYIETEAYGGATERPFLNCAAEIETCLPPERLLSELHRIEASAGRKREVRWGDRTLDIDVVFYGKRVIATDDLCVPHADYKNREFVLKPLLEIAPELVCPKCGKKLSAIYEELKNGMCTSHKNF